MKRTLKELRAKYGYTQKYVAEKMGISVQAYGAWEKDPGMIKARDANAIAHFYGLTLDDIFFTPKLDSESSAESA